MIECVIRGRTVLRIACSLLLALAWLAGALGCAQSPSPTPAGDRLPVVATTTIVADVVRQVGGEAIELTVLVPAGVDPHAYEATPRDVARIGGARAVFANGAGLEQFLEPLLAGAGGEAEVISVSEGIELHQLGAPDEHGHGEADPHVWTDPNNVIVWTHNIEAALSRLDAPHAGLYRANAEAYRGELRALDAWVREQVAQVPEDDRQLVTDHLAFGYFAGRYGFRQVGAVWPGSSTLAEPSAQELAALEEAIRRQGVKAVFVGATVNPGLAARITADTGTRLVTLHTGSLTPPGGEAGTYLDYVRHNVTAIVQALK